MIKKTLMITLYLILGYQAKAIYSIDALTAFNMEEAMMTRMPASDRGTAAKTPSKAPKKMKNICMIEAGDIGKLKYKGTSYEQAFSRVTDECFQRRTNLYVKARKAHPSQDRQIQFAESCVNSIKCI